MKEGEIRGKAVGKGVWEGGKGLLHQLASVPNLEGSQGNLEMEVRLQMEVSRAFQRWGSPSIKAWGKKDGEKKVMFDIQKIGHCSCILEYIEEIISFKNTGSIRKNPDVKVFRCQNKILYLILTGGGI